MIARYKKKTLLSRCECSYVQLGWLLVYSCLLVMAYIIVFEQQVSFYKFMDSLYGITGRQFLWSSSIPNNLRLMYDKKI